MKTKTQTEHDSLATARLTGESGMLVKPVPALLAADKRAPLDHDGRLDGA